MFVRRQHRSNTGMCTMGLNVMCMFWRGFDRIIHEALDDRAHRKTDRCHAAHTVVFGHAITLGQPSGYSHVHMVNRVATPTSTVLPISNTNSNNTEWGTQSLAHQTCWHSLLLSIFLSRSSLRISTCDLHLHSTHTIPLLARQQRMPKSNRQAAAFKRLRSRTLSRARSCSAAQSTPDPGAEPDLTDGCLATISSAAIVVCWKDIVVLLAWERISSTEQDRRKGMLFFARTGSFPPMARPACALCGGEMSDNGFFCTAHGREDDAPLNEVRKGCSKTARSVSPDGAPGSRYTRRPVAMLYNIGDDTEVSLIPDKH